jgi:hypothetical protein
MFHAAKVENNMHYPDMGNVGDEKWQNLMPGMLIICNSMTTPIYALFLITLYSSSKELLSKPATERSS